MSTAKLVRVTEPQGKIITSKKRFKIVNAGRRFGKSFLAGYEMLLQATQKENSIIWYIAPTLPMGRKIMWNDWLEKHVPKEWIAKKNEQMMVMKFKNGSVIYILTADDPDSLRGTGIDLMVIDEAAMIKAQDFWETIRPNLSDKWHTGRALIISTPKGFNWFYSLFKKSESDPEWDCFQFTTIEGGNVDEEELENARRTMSPKMFQQEYEASFETMANRIYYAFDRNLNSADGEEWFGKEGEVHVGIDFNVNPMTAVIFCEVIDRRRRIAIAFDEIVEPNSDTQHLSDSLKRKYPNCEIIVYPDPTCRKRQTNAVASQTDYDILKRNGFEVRVPHAPYPSKDKFNCCNANFRNAAGDRTIFIQNGTCPEYRKALEGYTYTENGSPDKNGGLDHISDAGAYYINYEFPIKARSVYKPEIQGV